MAQLVVGNGSQAVAVVLGDLINDLRLTDTDIGGDILCFFAIRLGLLSGSQFFGVAADGQHKGIGALLSTLILVGVVHRDGQFRLDQIVGLQFLLRDMVSHIIGRIKGGKGFQPVIDPNGVKGQNFPVLLGEVNYRCSYLYEYRNRTVSHL